MIDYDRTIIDNLINVLTCLDRLQLWKGFLLLHVFRCFLFLLPARRQGPEVYHLVPRSYRVLPPGPPRPKGTTDAWRTEPVRFGCWQRMEANEVCRFPRYTCTSAVHRQVVVCSVAQLFQGVLGPPSALIRTNTVLSDSWAYVKLR